MFGIYIAGTLEDSHILDLSRRITCEDELMELGVKVLKLSDFKIKSALHNKKPIQLAAHELLSTWFKQQSDRQTADTALHVALRKCDGFQFMAAELKQWVLGIGVVSELSKESM